jgi:hypothetical protein
MCEIQNMKKYWLAGFAVALFLSISSAAQLFMVSRYSANVIFSDQVEYAPLLEHADWHQLWADFQGHRRVFPKLLFLFTARLTRWDVRAETFLNWVFLQASVILLFFILKKHVTRRNLWIAGLSLVYFLVPQYYLDLLWGIQNCVQMNLLCVVWAVYLLSGDRATARTDIAVIALLTVATFSFASGLAAWPALLPLFAAGRPRGRLRIYAFAAAALAVYFFYFRDYHGYARLASIPGDPWKLISYFFSYLGGGAVVLEEYYRFPQELYTAAGMVLAAFFAAGFFYGKAHIQNKLPQICLALFILGTALMTALARTYTWDDNALDSRYVIMSMLFAVLVINIHLRGGNEAKPLALPVVILLIVLAVEIIPGWRAGMRGAQDWKAKMLEEAKVLRSYRTVPDGRLKENFVYSRGVRDKLAILEKLKYNIFNE